MLQTMAFIQNNLKNIGITAVIVIGGFFLYSYFFGGSNVQTGVLSVTTPAAVDGVVGKDLLILLANLQTLRLDDSVFNDPAFRSFKNFRVDISPESIGRENPFAPLSGSGSSQSSDIQIKSFKSN